jgi:hypothetical protein
VLALFKQTAQLLLYSSEFLEEVVNWCPHLWTMGWITRLIIDLHRHLAGQRFEGKLASNEIDFAESGIPKAALSDALNRLLAARKLLFELTGVFRKFGSTDVGEADDYEYLQQLLDAALGEPVVHCYLDVACLTSLFVRVQLGRQMSSTPCYQKNLTNRRALVLVLAVPTVSEKERGPRPWLEQSPRASELAWIKLTMKTNVMPIHYFTRYDAD